MFISFILLLNIQHSLSLKISLAVALAFLSLSAAERQAEDKSNACPAAIPLSVIVGDGRAVTPLTPAAFEARVHGRVARIATFDQDNTPKHILLVLDASKKVNAEAWKIQTSLASFLADGSPPQISFALIVLNVEIPPSDFATPRETLKSKLAALAAIRPGNAKEEEQVYDGLLNALRLFGTKQFGDSVFAFAGGSDDSSRIGLGEVQRAFIEQGVRLFGFVLSQRARSGYYMVITPSDAGPREIPWDPDTDEIGRLAIETGGLLAVENTHMPSVTYHLNEERLKQLQTTTFRFYTHIATPYRIQVATDDLRKPENWSIQLTKAIQAKVPNAKVLYPHQLTPCTAVGSR